MRDYVASNRIKATPEQLELLVPSFDSAWRELLRKAALRQRPAGYRKFKDQVAKIVVELVLDEGMTDQNQIRAAAVSRVMLTLGKAKD